MKLLQVHPPHPIPPQFQMTIVRQWFTLILNPDSENLIIRRSPITPPGLDNVWPKFLRTYLPKDYAENFLVRPRFLFSRDETVESQALAAAFGVASL